MPMVHLYLKAKFAATDAEVASVTQAVDAVVALIKPDSDPKWSLNVVPDPVHEAAPEAVEAAPAHEPESTPVATERRTRRREP